MDVKQVRDRLRAKGVQVDDTEALHLLALNEIVLDGIIAKCTLEKRPPLAASRLGIDAMRSLLLERGIRVAKDDPIFTLLAINEVILEDLAENLPHRLLSSRPAPQAIQGLSAYLKIIVPVLAGNALLSLSLSGLSAGWSLSVGIALGLAPWFFFKLRRPAPETETAVSATTNKKWSEAEFQRTLQIIRSTETISARTEAACKAVLVGGKDISAVSLELQVYSPQIRRAVSKLQATREQGL